MYIAEKQKLLDELRDRMDKDDTLPLKSGATRLVFGIGNPQSKILCIGEGPGYWEDQKGEPFVGNAGKLLDRLLGSIELDRNKVYITNVVHHRPPGNRDPVPEEMAAYGVYLDKMMEIIDPRLVVTLGRFSMAKFLPGAKISSIHGKLQKTVWRGRELFVIPMYHPAAALRNGDIMRQEKADFVAMGNLMLEIDKVEGNNIDQKTKVEQGGLF